MRDEPNNEPLIEETGLGLLPGMVLALAIVVFGMAAHLLKGAEDIARLGDHPKVRLGVQQHPQATPHDGVVVRAPA